MSLDHFGGIVQDIGTLSMAQHDQHTPMRCSVQCGDCELPICDVEVHVFPLHPRLAEDPTWVCVRTCDSGGAIVVTVILQLER